MPYSIYDHRHRFACWTAFSAVRLPAGFMPATTFAAILAETELEALITSPLNLPDNDVDLDGIHCEWRQSIIDTAVDAWTHRPLNHGWAAKVINIYLKTAFVCAGYHDHPRVRRLHPPIDGPLLLSLAEHNVGELGETWNDWHSQGWSNLNAADYQNVIDSIRQVMGRRPLWEIEEYWIGV